MYFIVNIDFFNDSNDLYNLLECVNIILNVISTGMNDGHIRFPPSSRSDVVYNVICGGTRMASSPFTCLIMEFPTIIIIFFFFFFFNFYTLIFFFISNFFSLNLTWRPFWSTGLYFLSLGDLISIHRTTLATLNILNGNMMRLMVT